MNSVVEMFGDFATLMPQLLDADANCGGLLALPFMDDEPGLDVSRGGTAMIVGLTAENAKPGNVVKAALLSTMFNLRLGSEVLEAQGYPRKELVLTGGLTRTPELAQLLADVFNTPVTLLESAEEGTAWGAALMAKFRAGVLQNQHTDWTSFLTSQSGGGHQKFESIAKNAGHYNEVYERYKRLMSIHARLDAVLG